MVGRRLRNERPIPLIQLFVVELPVHMIKGDAMKRLLLFATLLASTTLTAAEFQFDWSPDLSQKWIGRHFWQNSYRDWQQANGRVEVTHPGGNRSAVTTTYAIDATKDFTLTMRMGQSQDAQPDKTGWGGFKLGLQGNRIHTDNWKNQMIHCIGTPAGITADGRLFIDQVTEDAPRLKQWTDLTLRLTAHVSGDQSQLTLTAESGSEIHVISLSLPQKTISGMFALTSHNGTTGTDGRFDDGKRNDAGSLSHWFDELAGSGPGVVQTPERQFGPIAFNQFLTSSGTLRVNAQLAPYDETYVEALTLEIAEGESWKPIATARYDEPSSTALFLVPNWNIQQDVRYRISWVGTGFDGKSYTQHYEGTIPAQPLERDVVLGSFNCMHWTGFPYADSVSQMLKIQPDILAFTGDQLYEGAGGYTVYDHQ